MIGATNGLINVIMILLTEMGWAFAIIFCVILAIIFAILAIIFGAVAVEQAVSSAWRAPAKHPPTHLD